MESEEADIMKLDKWITGVALAAVLCALAVAAQSQDKAEIALRAAMEKEKVEGDLKGAVEQYKKLAQGNNRAIAAQALIHMGECYEKLGSKEADKQYELVLSKCLEIRKERRGAGPRAFLGVVTAKDKWHGDAPIVGQNRGGCLSPMAAISPSKTTHTIWLCTISPLEQTAV